MSELTSDQAATDQDAKVNDPSPDAADATDNPASEASEGEICGECWPAGWPESAGANAAHCSHGEWTR